MILKLNVRYVEDQPDTCLVYGVLKSHELFLRPPDYQPPFLMTDPNMPITSVSKTDVGVVEPLQLSYKMLGCLILTGVVGTSLTTVIMLMKWLELEAPDDAQRFCMVVST